MSAPNRSTLINKLFTALKKHYTPTPPQPARPLLEHLIYASLLQDAPADLADEGMAKCEQDFFDWNEVRVTTVSELSQVLGRLPDANKAAQRVKSNLQSVFEEFYTFDIDHLKKENLGKAVAKFEKMPGVTPFVLSYTVQHGLGGHSIPVDYSAMVILMVTEIASQPEAAGGKVPGLERAISKSKGIEFSDLLHQAAVELSVNTKSKKARSLVDEVAKGSSKRLDEWLSGKKEQKKRVAARKAAAAEAAEEEAEQVLADAKTAGKADPKAKTKKSSKSSANQKTVAPASKTEAQKTKPPTPPSDKVTTSTSTAKKKTSKKKPVASAKEKKPAKKSSKAASKSIKPDTSSEASSKKKTGNRKLTKRKPR
ncbi:hypothetical protein Q31b_21390 [Novipirellula aureliae]|uniref:Uncharacterized protein n=1 Tax=Novipirellula aureliae TaxID=2527966 RepID=A0A5C6E2E5_9BACT|nr:hypothetical protein [Novipirellula aureliae]TWU43102.1 hypothetical protein Q31b_21390 [Novipirellula aureliae]